MAKETAMKDQSHPPQAYDLILSGRKVHFWKGGTGQALLLIHSAWGDAEMSWGSVWDRLSDAFTVIAPDLPGFGQSSPIDQPALSAMAQSLKEFVEALDLSRVIVVGNSFGAAVAVQFACDFPERTAQVVLVNGGYMPVLPGVLRRLIAWPPVNRAFRRLMFYFSFSTQALKKSFVDPSKLRPDFFARIKRNAPIYAPVVFDAFMNIPGPLPVPKIPTFLVWGKQDGLTPIKQAKALQKRFPGTMLISIDSAGHMPQVERPREFVTAIVSTGKNAR
jgi:pimeloyl-ACP methyl ester carboxylesterase